ncbi:hypothetical protein LSUE1_G009491 [Lachnellula suecica]|uniref:Mmc1 C-terminal domain-containing protein n=1 Tax=Lachnellula suecica TaxID=602035 RepID=A0A8T9BS05_9HELO|nr:hypothetical protein LSUE1_G009491 [Lachnellula suecica]
MVRVDSLFKDRPRQHRQQSRTASTSIDTPKTTPKSPRAELRDAVLELQKYAANHVNISKLQLALRGLEQTPGEETVRIAILGVMDPDIDDGLSSKWEREAFHRAKELLRLLLADPLKPEEEWERILLGKTSQVTREGELFEDKSKQFKRNDYESPKAILLKVGSFAPEEMRFSSPMVQELHVSSPVLNGYKLEILVGDISARRINESHLNTIENLDSILVPTMQIPTSSTSTGRYTPVTMPVHKAMLVGHGLRRSASMFNLPPVAPYLIRYVADLQCGADEIPRCRFIDIDRASSALKSFRESVDNAFDYERNWFASGIPELVEWLQDGSSNEAGSGVLKPALAVQLETLISSTQTSLLNTVKEVSDGNIIDKTPFSDDTLDVPLDLTSLRNGLSEWAEGAHGELRDQLDTAFNGRRWRKLGWWKLFWRVDDVSMIATDILHQRFLIDAEKEVIFLAGRIEEAGVFKRFPQATPENWAYRSIELEQIEPKMGVAPPPPRVRDLIQKEDTQDGQMKNQPWPLNIPLTRAYLATGTVPALQALAQKLVLQTLTTSSFVSAFAALTYISTLSTSFYEAGAIAAVGIVWSLRRMQGKWETARKFWEGEVREEGRKAVRAVEGIVGDVLKDPEPLAIEKDLELEKANAAVEKVERKLEELNKSASKR